MGADYSKELPSSWDQKDVQDWKTKALEILKMYYTGFAGSQWHEFNRRTDCGLLRAKICFAMYGPPTEDADEIENAYSDEQRKKAQDIMNVILQVHDQSPSSALRVGFVFVSCKQDEQEFVLPVFSVFVGNEASTGFELRKYVDAQCRIYSDWNDWKNNNNLPMLKYCYPTRGFFTCSGSNDYKFSLDHDPDVEYGTSPQCDASARVGRQVDIASAATALGTGVVFVVGMFTPLAPVILTTAAVAGTASASYGAARGISRLVDKGQHGENLADMESMMLWFSLAATPLHFATSFVNGTIAVGAQQGRIFSSSMRMFTTILNFTTLGLDATLLGFGLANLINKYINHDLTSLDILQFSMSVFFFTNTLMQPKVASKIIRRAQEQHFDRYMNSMSDAEAKQSMDNFLRQNAKDGSITDRSKIVRTINRMEDPNKFFKNVGTDAQVKIGGRKGKTVLVSDTHGHETRINPNRVVFNQYTNQPGTTRFDSTDSKKLNKCYKKVYNGRQYNDLNDVELNGEKIFANLTDAQKRRISKVFGGTARFNENIVSTAHSVAERMGFNNADQLMTVMEIVAAKIKGIQSPAQQAAALRMMLDPSFINGIRHDLGEAMRLAQRAGLHFDDPLTAVYHYRKHGVEFPKAIAKFGNTIDVYLGPVRNEVFREGNIKEICRLPNGHIKKIYAATGDKYGVMISTPDGRNISTMFTLPGCGADFATKLAAYFENAPGPLEPISDVAGRLVRFLGLRGLQICITVDGKSTPVEKCLQLDPAVHQHIVDLLNGLVD